MTFHNGDGHLILDNISKKDFEAVYVFVPMTPDPSSCAADRSLIILVYNNCDS
jgi:hypothetical protein